ncbi:carboxypeptidase M32 [Sulfuracidifex metallicus]|uniref:Metal-dependent carboxypeptidase n=1 Tax=Sulfuracidifex metallicus DSM 6482 = JCM 9184 TaxID=523847 RepID=A0A6A9QM02_SULME|nr:carboxypeptidase M32 [Sulfuracidifex metallicus]MUN30036.1 carboxypeptidase M32 [Sulfuracidifex metallicus DSM 6482 = JCM 9184]WOE51584.1 carboxypeptidase M32 [Sulfuracidifex metallicus DSM 6482 = JCM 9184]
MSSNSILTKFKEIWAISHAIRLMGWDIETYMPPEGISYRAEEMATLNSLRRRKLLEIKGELDDLDPKNDMEAGIKRVLGREIKYIESIPEEIDMEINKLTAESAVVWRNARLKNDFSSFKPYLERIVELKAKVAQLLGYNDHPYSSLLDLYEEGLTVKEADDIFGSLLPSLKRTLQKVEAEGRFTASSELENEPYSREIMEKIVNEIAYDILKMPTSKFRIDLSAHPFTTGINRHDVRITMRYEGFDFKRALYSLVHESGHAIYELQIDEALEFTPIAEAPSFGIHESQSRFWENNIGRSKDFVELIYPRIKPLVKGKSVEEIYRYFNAVKLQPIRVDADELTYNFHIAVRYFAEKKLIDGSLSVNELPEFFDETLENYLGIRPKSYSEGVLQDIHWSHGSFGYFPSYTIGNMVAAVVYHHMNLGDGVIKGGKIDIVKGWLREKIHKFGATYPPKELLRRSFGEDYNPARLVEYLENKYIGTK